jgi:hypothetical protein
MLVSARRVARPVNLPDARADHRDDLIRPEARARWMPGATRSTSSPASVRRKAGTRSACHPRLPQRLPTNQRAPKREERRVDVGALFVPDAQAPELVAPRKRPLHDPPPPAQATPMLRAAHGQQGHDVTSPETASNRRRVVAAIPEHTVRPLPPSPRSPCSGGIPASDARASCESFRLATVGSTDLLDAVRGRVSQT